MFSKILNFILLFIFLSSCTAQKIIEASVSTGITKSPQSRSASDKNYGEYTISDVEINFVHLNKLTDKLFDYYNNKKIDTLDHKVKEYSDIYNYKYEYVLGPADIININLTDTDDLDDEYKIDENGMIDLPFAGKVKINDLSVTEAHSVLTNVIREYYKNPDLQVNIQEFNSSKVHVVGAVANQITIDLNQEPVNLIEAAIQAKFSKASGTKGFLRRDNKI